MTNLSYCRFRNTYRDLRDCIEHMDDPVETEDDDGISKDEDRARCNLIVLCKEIADGYLDPDEGH